MNPALVSATPNELSLAVDHNNRYPGELLTVFARFPVPKDLPGSVFQITMPRSVKIETYDLPTGVPVTLPAIMVRQEDIVFQLPLQDHFFPGGWVELSISARLSDLRVDHYLAFEAALYRGDGQLAGAENLRVAVRADGQYLRHLPELYATDEFVSRMLMMFESFWKPINQQIDQVEHYFDPGLAPQDMLPWLAMWTGLPYSPELPAERLRLLIKNSLYLSQCRGTLAALRRFLEIVTAGKVELREQRATNFVLGPKCYLGSAMALGKNNQPDSILIKLTLPPGEVRLADGSRELYKDRLSNTIKSLVPVNTTFDLQCEFETATEGA